MSPRECVYVCRYVNIYTHTYIHPQICHTVGMSPKECVELVEYMTRKCPMLHFAGVSAATQLGRDPEVQCVCLCVRVFMCVCAAFRGCFRFHTARS